MGLMTVGYVYDYIDEREAIAAIPPRKDAKIWFHGNRKGPAHLVMRTSDAFERSAAQFGKKRLTITVAR